MIKFDTNYALGLIKKRNPNVLREGILHRVESYFKSERRITEAKVSRYLFKEDIAIRGDGEYYKIPNLEKLVREITNDYKDAVDRL